MENNKRKLIAYLTACSMFLSGCKLHFEDIIDIEEFDIPQKDFSITQESTSTLEIEETEEAPVTEKPEEILPINQPPKNEIVSATVNTYMYSSNTDESLKICEFKINEAACKILSCDNNWLLVRYNNQIGYICNDHLEYTAQSVEQEYTHQKQNDIVLTTTGLNFRTFPTTESEIIKTFPENTELEVIAEVDNGWLLVKNNGIIGYVHKDYTISMLERAKEQYPKLNIMELDTKKLVYATTDLNVRTGTNTDDEIIYTLQKYESVRVIEEYDEWYFIMTNDYKFGFVNKNYTKELEDIFVIVDLSEQRLYMYNDEELCYIALVTTGKSSTPSDIGSFKIWYKGRNEEIVPGYIVDYWMPYNSAMEGLHDAERWRKEGYGTDNYIYNGSNGCINMRHEDAKAIYDNVSIGTKVLVHK